MIKTLEQDLLRESLSYDPDTGVFTWREARANGKIKAGSIAGSKKPDGYNAIKVNGTKYNAHRLAWIYIYGSIPEGLQIDHKNGIRDDNSLGNLRLATQPQQRQNQKKLSNNTSGFIGVTWYKPQEKWGVRIGIQGKSVFLGYFDTPEEASKAYVKAKIRLHTFNPIQRTS